jgi:MFS family permease
MVWVVVQNAAVGVFCLFVGPLADTFGNRLTLRTLIFGSVIGPLLAASLSYMPGTLGARLFWTLFIALGITPLVLRILVNYALEICGPEQHPRYLSTISLCVAAPFLLSPLVGWLVDVVGFEPVFFTAAGLVLLAGLLTFRLDEPRHRLRFGEPAVVEGGGDE